jgi:hypothetical protein
VCLGFLSVVQFSTPGLVGNDGYYHVRMAALMREHGLRPDFIWLPLTILNPDQYVDHHFLYHVLLIPFTFGDLILGAKWASVLFAATGFAALGWLLHRQQVPRPGQWAMAGLALSEAFIYRVSMARAQSLSLVFLLLAVGWLVGGQHRRLLPLGFLYVWLYEAFPLLLLACACYVAAERLLGGRRMEVGTATALLLGLSLAAMLFQARRFVEYFPPLALVFAALAWAPLLRRPAKPEARHTTASDQPGRSGGLARRQVVAAAAALGGLAVALWFGLQAAAASVGASRSPHRFQAAAAWLVRHTPLGSRLFQTDWDDFPWLFFYNTHNTYTLGLDPTYLQQQDPALHQQWVDLTQGRSEDLPSAIRQTFGAEWALTDLNHERFLSAAADDPQMREVYRDEFAVVFAVEAGP